MPEAAHNGDGPVRIGELSRRVGISTELLRAWERRYDLIAPARTPGGLRLYGAQEERRVRRMLEHLGDGLAAAEAARLTREEFEQGQPDARSAGGPPALSAASPPAPSVATPPAPAAIGDLRLALDDLDQAGADAALDRLLSCLSLAAVVSEAVLPYLCEVGERWERDGDGVIAQEHFASTLLRGRLLALARGWGGGHGPMALLACAPGDQHDLGLICFGLALREEGWRITFLGPDTPLGSTVGAARALKPALTVLAAKLRRQKALPTRALAELAAQGPLAVAGPGISPRLARQVGARYLDDDPFSAAALIAAELAVGGLEPAVHGGSGPRTSPPAQP